MRAGLGDDVVVKTNVVDNDSDKMRDVRFVKKEAAVLSIMTAEVDDGMVLSPLSELYSAPIVMKVTKKISWESITLKE